jgi:hypothetical protein
MQHPAYGKPAHGVLRGDRYMALEDWAENGIIGREIIRHLFIIFFCTLPLILYSSYPLNTKCFQLQNSFEDRECMHYRQIRLYRHVLNI